MAGPRGEVGHMKSWNDLPRLTLAASKARHLEFFGSLEVCFCSARCVAAKNVDEVSEQPASMALPGLKHVGERCDSPALDAVLEAMLVDCALGSISAPSYQHDFFRQLAKTRQLDGITRHVLQRMYSWVDKLYLEQSTSG